jgi:leucyl-tRNA---protein transferase
LRHQALPDTRFFFSTAPLPCPYIEGRIERRVVTELVGRDANALHDQLSMAGFRRSHGICYVPACPSCDACVAVRVVVDEFKPGKSFNRILKRNSDLTAEVVEPVATHEQYALFSDYQRSRHNGGDMSKMDFLDYQALIEDTPVNTFVVEFRRPSGTLAGACLVDRLSDGLICIWVSGSMAVRTWSINRVSSRWSGLRPTAGREWTDQARPPYYLHQNNSPMRTGYWSGILSA